MSYKETVKKSARYPWQRYGLFLLFALAFFGFFSHRIAVIYTDWLWHNSAGSRSVFLRVYGARFFLFSVFGAASFLLGYFNVWLADRISPPSSVSTPDRRELFPIINGKPVGRLIQMLSGFRRVLDFLLLIGAFIFAIIAGFSAQSEWDSFLRFNHPEAFGLPDPQFGKDLGFYVFTLPFLQFVQGWSLSIALLIGAGVTVVYLYQQGINRASGNMVMLPHVRGHLSVIVGIAFLLRAWGYTLDGYALLFNAGPIPGAHYTDIYVRLPFLQVLLIAATISALASFINVWRRTIILPVAAITIWLATTGVGIVWPFIYHRIQVASNEGTLDAPFVRRAIAATRNGYGLSSLKIIDWTDDSGKSADADESDRPALVNFPIWERDPLQQVLPSQQGFRQFAVFSEARNDRYRLADQVRMVQVATREISAQKLDSRAYNWPNIHLRYTHGFGVVALSGNTSDGSPDYLLSGLPPVTGYESLTLHEPRIYFGDTMDSSDYVIVNAHVPEMDISATPDRTESETRYAARNGVRLTPLARLAFAVRFGAASLLLSREVDAQSRLLYARQVVYRVKRIAPFLHFDRAATPIIAEGRLLWLINAYTTAESFPYSAFSTMTDELTESIRYNYIRPSVTATVDAYDGTVHLYITDDQDPVIRSYRRIFPHLFRDFSNMPASVRLHRKYPRELFRTQRKILLEYHTEAPETFFNRSDIWRLPPGAFSASTTTSNSSNDSREHTPYAAITRLTGTGSPEYVVLSSFTPQGKTNLAGLLMARCDEPHFGELRLYRFASNRSLPGPEQMERRVRTDIRLASYLEQISSVGVPYFGSMRVLPVGNHLFYIQSLYVSPTKGSDSTSLTPPPPQLRRIIVATPDKVGFASSVDEAFSSLISITASPAESIATVSHPVNVLIKEAADQYEHAQEALRAGDFARYGRENQALGVTLRRLRLKTAPSPAPPSPPVP